MKTFDEFINEELEPTIKVMQDTTAIYNKYKSKVKSFIKTDDIQGSQATFTKFIESLKEDEKGASDMLRSYFSMELLVVKINQLKNDKVQIDKEIQERIKELNTIKSKL